jgi:hypothetical protein
MKPVKSIIPKEIKNEYSNKNYIAKIIEILVIYMIRTIGYIFRIFVLVLVEKNPNICIT